MSWTPAGVSFWETLQDDAIFPEAFVDLANTDPVTGKKYGTPSAPGKAKYTRADIVAIFRASYQEGSRTTTTTRLAGILKGYKVDEDGAVAFLEWWQNEPSNPSDPKSKPHFHPAFDAIEGVTRSIYSRYPPPPPSPQDIVGAQAWLQRLRHDITAPPAPPAPLKAPSSPAIAPSIPVNALPAVIPPAAAAIAPVDHDAPEIRAIRKRNTLDAFNEMRDSRATGTRIPGGWLDRMEDPGSRLADGLMLLAKGIDMPVHSDALSETGRKHMKKTHIDLLKAKDDRAMLRSGAPGYFGRLAEAIEHCGWDGWKQCIAEPSKHMKDQKPKRHVCNELYCTYSCSKTAVAIAAAYLPDTAGAWRHVQMDMQISASAWDQAHIRILHDGFKRAVTRFSGKGKRRGHLIDWSGRICYYGIKVGINVDDSVDISFRFMVEEVCKLEADPMVDAIEAEVNQVGIALISRTRSFGYETGLLARLQAMEDASMHLICVDGSDKVFDDVSEALKGRQLFHVMGPLHTSSETNNPEGGPKKKLTCDECGARARMRYTRPVGEILESWRKPVTITVVNTANKNTNTNTNATGPPPASQTLLF